MRALVMYATDLRKFGTFAVVSKKRRNLLRDSVGCEFCIHAGKHFRMYSEFYMFEIWQQTLNAHVYVLEVIVGYIHIGMR